MNEGVEQLCKRLGYRFRDPALLEQALTHRSANRRRNNERLEFLGDALLSQIVSGWLFEHFPDASEGQLTRMRASLVRGPTLAEVARELLLGESLYLGGGELKSGGSRRDSILADALEAVIGAIMLDGGEEPCRRVVLEWFNERLKTVSPQSAGKDPKTRLQEWLQADQHSLPEYDVLHVRGQAPAQEFEVICRLAAFGEDFSATGPSRRKAEQRAAREALAWLGRGKDD